MFDWAADFVGYSCRVSTICICDNTFILCHFMLLCFMLLCFMLLCYLFYVILFGMLNSFRISYLL